MKVFDRLPAGFVASFTAVFAAFCAAVLVAFCAPVPAKAAEAWDKAAAVEAAKTPFAEAGNNAGGTTTLYRERGPCPETLQVLISRAPSGEVLQAGCWGHDGADVVFVMWPEHGVVRQVPKSYFRVLNPRSGLTT